MKKQMSIRKTAMEVIGLSLPRRQLEEKNRKNPKARRTDRIKSAISSMR